MNKAELVSAMAEKTALSKKDAEAALKAFTDIVAEELKKGEKIHFIDKAINLEIKTVKQYQHVGHSGPGLFKGNRYNVGVARPIERTELVQHRGILYVTNQRIVFQASEWGFDKTYRYLTAITPYIDACEMQFGNKTYNMIVADGNLLYQALQLVKQRRQIP